MNPFTQMRRAYDRALKKSQNKFRKPESPKQPLRPLVRQKPETAKKRYKQTVMLTPNRSVGRLTEPEGVVLHHCGGSPQGTISWILNDASNVSYHVYIKPDGSRVQFCRYSDYAWHAGHSKWRGRYECNKFTVGISFYGDTYQRMPTKDEVASFVDWWTQTAPKFGWTTDDITTHREVSPGRKYDPSPEFTDALLAPLK